MYYDDKKNVQFLLTFSPAFFMDVERLLSRWKRQTAVVRTSVKNGHVVESAIVNFWESCSKQRK